MDITCAFFVWIYYYCCIVFLAEKFFGLVLQSVMHLHVVELAYNVHVNYKNKFVLSKLWENLCHILDYLFIWKCFNMNWNTDGCVYWTGYWRGIVWAYERASKKTSSKTKWYCGDTRPVLGFNTNATQPAWKGYRPI